MSQPLERAVAVILAAGLGRRLGGSHDGPKCLLEMGGRTLLARHIESLRANGVTQVSITTGHQGERVRVEAARLGAGVEIAFVENPRFHEGSLVSLQVQGERLRAGQPVVLMDADVLCDARMIARLGGAQAENLLLLDRQIEPGDEPVKICLRDGAIVDFAKRPDDLGERFGESVGFFRLSGDMAAALADRCDAFVQAGRADAEYEAALRELILAEPDRFAAVDVSDLPWTEIDFEDDVARARQRILPELSPEILS